MDANNKEPTKPTDFDDNCKEIAMSIIKIAEAVKPGSGTSKSSKELDKLLKKLCTLMKDSNKFVIKSCGEIIVVSLIIETINNHIQALRKNYKDVSVANALVFDEFGFEFVSSQVSIAFMLLEENEQRQTPQIAEQVPELTLSAINTVEQKKKILADKERAEAVLKSSAKEEARIVAEEKEFEKTKNPKIKDANTEVNHPDDDDYGLPDGWDDETDEEETVNNVNSVEQPNQEHEPMLSLADKVVSYPQQNSIPNKGIG